MQRLVRPTRLDHVAVWTAGREELAGFLCEHLGMHRIEETDRFTLVGADARLGKLTLFAADGPRDPGVLERVVLRVSDIDGALARLPAGTRIGRADGVCSFDGPQGLGLGLVEAPGEVEYDLDHVVLSVRDPERVAAELASLGFSREDGRLVVADKHLRLSAGAREAEARPLLNHLALLVDSAQGLDELARRRGHDVADVVDAPNTFAVFVWGPERIKIEYVEHKPGFALV